jgi:hypothetical protein
MGENRDRTESKFLVDRRDLLLMGAAMPFVPLAVKASAATTDTPFAFAEREIAALAGRKPKIAFRIDPALGEQAYRFERTADSILIVAGDETGAMYGGLDIAEALRTNDDALTRLLADTKARTPFILQRGIKFNIPLDLRTPSYGDGGDSARANIPEVWERGFWTDYLDEMARNRYNVLTLWNTHPFPSMVKVPEYPDVALSDVWRSVEPLGPAIIDPHGTMQDEAKYLDNHEVVRKMTIGQKISFWRDVMAMAQNRGIKVYIFTWNVFTYGTFGKYGISDAMDNPTTVAYMRASVRELIKTYPLLAGIGITAGENMGDWKVSPAKKEEWLWATYGEGVRDALQDGKRRVHLIHRFHQTSGTTINRVWKDYPGFPESFTFSHKYSIAHMYSTPRPTFFESEGRSSLQGKQTWLTVRNDDLYSLRWGDPDFAREYISNMPKAPVLAGFYMGPDGYCWGRDFLDRETAGRKLGARRPLVMEKHWYSFALWGRLSFDPALPDRRFRDMLAARYPGVDPDELFAAGRHASQVIPATTSFFWRDIDLQWLPEACVHSSGWGIAPKDDKPGAVFYTVADFLMGKSASGTKILSIREWRKKVLAGEPLAQPSPLDSADTIGGAAEQALERIGNIRKEAPDLSDRDLRQTLGDFEAMGYLGRYYSAKIRGACELALFDGTRDTRHRESAVEHLREAVDSWRDYAAIHAAQYLPNFFARMGWVDVKALTTDAVKDIDIAQGWQPGTIM